MWNLILLGAGLRVECLAPFLLLQPLTKCSYTKIARLSLAKLLIKPAPLNYKYYS